MASAVSATETTVKTSVENADQLSGTGFGDATKPGADDTPMDDGDLGFLESNGSYYKLNKLSNQPVSDFDILYTTSARLSNGGPGRWERLLTMVSPSFLTVNDIFINAVNGNDQNSGLTANKALKTFAEFRKRIGVFNTLNPSSGKLTVHILTDLPNTDPISFQVLLAPKTTFYVEGVDKILLANVTADTIVNKDRSTNTPWEIIVNAFAANGWTPYVGKAITFLDSAAPNTRSYVAKDLGAKTAHMTEWVIDGNAINPPSPNAIGIPPTFVGGNPVSGNKFNIVDYPQVTLGLMVVGWDPSQFIDFFGNEGGAVLRFLHINSGFNAVEQLFPQCMGDVSCASTLSNCIVDDQILVPGPNAKSFATNCCFNGQFIVLNGARIIQFGGLVLWPGSLTVEPHGHWLGELDPTFQGGGAFLFKSTPFFVNGLAEAGAVSFWNQETDGFAEMLNINTKASFISQPFSIFFGENGFEPFWGSGNNTTTPGQRIVLEDNDSLLLIGQVGFGVAPPLPSIELDPNPVVFGQHRAPPPFGSVNAFSWNDAGPGFTGPVAFTWAGLNVAQPAGFQTDSAVDGSGTTHTASSAQDPSVHTLLYRWSSF